MLRLVLLFLSLTLSGSSAISDCRQIHQPQRLAADSPRAHQLAAELAREHMAGSFDGAVLVREHQTVLLKQGFGCADRARRVANGGETISDMGSVAKTFTAAAVLQLMAQEKLQRSDRLERFFPRLPAALKPITIEQLLGHSSGMDNFHNNSDFERMDKAEALRRIFAMPLIAAPGEKRAYSNAAYTLLAAIIEEVSGQPFRAYVHAHLLQPLGLMQTGFYGDDRLAGQQLARGYGGDDAGGTTFDKGLSWALLGAGGMVSSLDDLARWASSLAQGSFLPKSAASLASTAANERWLLSSLARVEILGESVIQMGGSTDYGYTALIQFLPRREGLVVLLLNAHGSKYKNATHHRLSRDHILPILLERPADRRSDSQAQR